MTAEQALQNIYAAARALNASADIHESLKKCFEIVYEALLPEKNQEVD